MKYTVGLLLYCHRGTGILFFGYYVLGCTVTAKISFHLYRHSHWAFCDCDPCSHNTFDDHYYGSPEFLFMAEHYESTYRCFDGGQSFEPLQEVLALEGREIKVK